MSYGQALLLVAALMSAAYVAGVLAGIAVFAWLDAAAAREREGVVFDGGWRAGFADGELTAKRKFAESWPRRPR